MIGSKTGGGGPTEAAPPAPEEFTISSKELDNQFGYMKKSSLQQKKAAAKSPVEQEKTKKYESRQSQLYVCKCWVRCCLE